MASPSREGQTLGGDSLLVRYANFVRLPHTVFALPFALIGAVAASWTSPVTWRQVVLVVIAFTAARFVAMGFNRIADRDLDAKNPRTASRDIPQGRISVREAWVSVTLAALVFEGSAWALNSLCFALSPIALVAITGYSYTKRFTWSSHLWLGLADAISGPAGYLAITGKWCEPWWVLPVLALVVTAWVGGFDMFYALQDEEFDRKEGLHSAVVRFGAGPAIFLAKTLHGLAILALVAFGLGAGFHVPFFVGVGIGAALIAWEHQLVKPGDLSKLNAAFFTMNGIISITVFIGALVDRIV
ncbi:MAG TPA: UbiA-like polyprenyltransferase [Gemmatimonadales bacterium]|nr:UbiA-like polyprenyltransferase [Gemmatimonadales bacterium]